MAKDELRTPWPIKISLVKHQWGSLSPLHSSMFKDVKQSPSLLSISLPVWLLYDFRIIVAIYIRIERLPELLLYIRSYCHEQAECIHCHCCGEGTCKHTQCHLTTGCEPTYGPWQSQESRKYFQLSRRFRQQHTFQFSWVWPSMDLNTISA